VFGVRSFDTHFVRQSIDKAFVYTLFRAQYNHTHPADSKQTPRFHPCAGIKVSSTSLSVTLNYSTAAEADAIGR